MNRIHVSPKFVSIIIVNRITLAKHADYQWHVQCMMLPNLFILSLLGGKKSSPAIWVFSNKVSNEHSLLLIFVFTLSTMVGCFSSKIFCHSFLFISNNSVLIT